ncbi:DUF3570 domain-containing protein [Opitutus terrae]|uniref:DUF3570 domain-containing protein n=1 Tax=Opitutus terrae (strain DSM 11246 / JCM 15787 / PB90-1) TaxID=452637 RepID=B1ZTW1_OPITP|nr:DUF3570 domain-containing protein [Opitutus terrae]ACB74894.1 hypothetical protein Oter_1610 [Opitutus terrae PB90-1]
MRLRPSSFPPLRAVWLLLLWLVVPQRSAKAETGVSYKFADYRESGDRIAVRSHYGLVEQTIGTDMRLRVNGVIDAIAGATPTGQPPETPGGPVPLTTIHDRRKAWGAEFFRQFPRIGVTLGAANSRESDYVSTGWSLNTLTDFNQKNTTLLLGVAGTDDDIKVFYQTERAKKRTTDLIAGVTQLLDARTSVVFNLGYGHSEGFHADPYRLIQKRVEIFPGVVLPRTFGENRPDERDKWTAYAAVNRAYPALHGAVEANYRWFHDSFGTNAHTVELAWFQQLGARLTLRPGIRYYQQSAADFYRIDLEGTNILPGERPNPAGPFFSADYRLSALRSTTYGLKAIATLTEHWQLDASIERYEMRGRDGLTSPSAYPRAVLVNVGVRLTW